MSRPSVIRRATTKDTDLLFQIYAVFGPQLVGRAAGPAVIVAKTPADLKLGGCNTLTAMIWEGAIESGERRRSVEHHEISAVACFASGFLSLRRPEAVGPMRCISGARSLSPKGRKAYACFF